MKIGIVLDQYIPQDGGAHTLQGELLSAICRLGERSQHHITVFSPKNEEIKEQVISSGLQWCAYGRSGFLYRTLSLFWPKLRFKLKLKSSLERKSAENGIEFLWFLSPRIDPADLPYMTIVLDLQHRLQPWFPEVSANGEWGLRERHYAQLLPRAAAVIVGTQAGRKEVHNFYNVPEERIHILPHPAPQAELKVSEDDADSLQGLGVKPGYIFYPAQFWAHKNHINLLRAIAILRDEGVSLDVVFTGADFGNRNHIEQEVIKLELTKRVRCLGFVRPAELKALYRNALALTYLSFFGPENLPPLEAFALGCPVIAAQVDGAQEQLGEAAVLVDPRDPVSIAQGIKRVLQDTNLRDQMVQKGHVRAKTWTADQFVDGALHVIEAFTPIRNTWQ